MTTDTGTFDFDRRYLLPPDRMWHLMTDPAMREKWGAPGDHVLTIVTADLRVGGTDRHRCGPADAPEFEVETRWYRLDALTDAVFTEVIEAGGMTLGASLVTYRLAPDGPGTRLWVTVAASSYVGAEMMDEFRSGWSGGMNNLDALVAATQAH